MGRHLRGMGAEPAFARGAFTVLFDLSILRHEVRWGQGHDLGLSGADDHWGTRGMIREGLAMTELPGEAVGTMNGFGRKVVGPIEGHHQLSAQDAKMRQHAVLFKARKDLQKHGIEVAWRDGIEELADLIVTGNVLHIEQGMDVIVPFRVLQSALVLQKRWRLGEKKCPRHPRQHLGGRIGYWAPLCDAQASERSGGTRCP